MKKLQSDPVELFTKVATRYEFLNTVLTLGWDRKWREALLKTSLEMLEKEPKKIHDLATGTGDFLRLMAKKWPEAEIHASDPNKAMLSVARTHLKNKALKNIFLKEGRAEKLEAKEESFDLVSIGFGFRNVAPENRPLALKECFRVLKKGKVLAILELGMPKRTFFYRSYQFLLTRAMPLLASLFSTKASYDYLAESIIHFPSPEEVKAMIENTGFSSCHYKALSGGVCWLFCAKK